MKKFKFIIFLLVLFIIFGFSFSCATQKADTEKTKETESENGNDEYITELESELNLAKSRLESAEEEIAELKEELDLAKAKLEEKEELAEEVEEEAEAEFISINEITSFNEWDYKVIDVEIHKALDDERARGQYVVFIVEVTNNAKMEREVGCLFQVEDQEGRVFGFDSSASLNHHQSYRTDTWHLEDIGPSFTATMPIAFDVAEDVETLFLYPTDIREEDFKDTAIIMYEVVN
jgi:hypothetical protein